MKSPATPLSFDRSIQNQVYFPRRRCRVSNAEGIPVSQRSQPSATHSTRVESKARSRMERLDAILSEALLITHDTGVSESTINAQVNVDGQLPPSPTPDPDSST